MKTLYIVTETGSEYEFTNNLCIKNGKVEFKMWWSYCFDDYDKMTLSEVPKPFIDEDSDKRLPLQVGKRMYVGGKDSFWISTRIVSIIEET
jgi:hypothetical protein